LIKKNGVVPLKADYTSGSPEIKAILNKYGSNALPFYLIFPGQQPDSPIILQDLITKGDVLAALEKAGPSLGTATASSGGADAGPDGKSAVRPASLPGKE
jgi:hypothetical protein